MIDFLVILLSTILAVVIASHWIDTSKQIRLLAENDKHQLRLVEELAEKAQYIRDDVTALGESLHETKNQATEAQGEIEGLSQRMKELEGYFAKMKEIRTWVQA